MKNRRLSSCFVLLVASLMSIFCITCQKRHTTKFPDNKLIPISLQQKTNNQYVIYCSMGHSESTCKGCVMIDGVMRHIDCQGGGNMCRKVSHVSLISTGTTLYATTLDTIGFTDLDILNIPARSLSLEIDEGVYSYLNIPAQLVYRDTATQQFTFTGLFFSNTAAYTND